MRDGTLRYIRKAAGGRAEAREPPAGTYWRRRFVVLGICLVALAGTAWSLSLALTVRPMEPTARTGISGPRTGTTGRASPAGSATGPGHAATSSHVGSQGQHGLGTGPVTAPAPDRSAAAGDSGGVKPRYCPWHAVVLSLVANQIQFGPIQQPVFRLSVVSTLRTACSFDVGPGHLALVIKEGSARIWSSGDCVNGAGSQVVALRRGVPEILWIAWDRNISSPGCGGPVRRVPPAGYTAYAVDGPLVSAPLGFRLR
jgi:hypothetical protein